MDEYNALPVCITYKFTSDTDKVVTKELFPRGCLFPSTKTITFDNKLGDMDLLVHYNSKECKLVPGLPDQVAHYLIKTGKLRHADKQSKFKFVLKISLNIHQIPCLESAEVVEEWVEEEKIVVKKATPPVAKPAEPKEGEAPAETTPVQPTPPAE